MWKPLRMDTLLPSLPEKERLPMLDLPSLLLLRTRLTFQLFRRTQLLSVGHLLPLPPQPLLPQLRHQLPRQHPRLRLLPTPPPLLVDVSLHLPLPRSWRKRLELISPPLLELDLEDVSLPEMYKVLPLEVEPHLPRRLLLHQSHRGHLLLELSLPLLLLVHWPKRQSWTSLPLRELENSDVLLLMMLRLPLERRRLLARLLHLVPQPLWRCQRDLFLSLECNVPYPTTWKLLSDVLSSVLAVRLRWMPSMLVTNP
mmetsp:Transcript_5195/g.11472  ORF Transcript_5195/g.11472 Transcript_5195/m.11472 type:complete len:255 (+) Transcript_5195:823-1587(+)